MSVLIIIVNNFNNDNAYLLSTLSLYAMLKTHFKL